MSTINGRHYQRTLCPVRAAKTDGYIWLEIFVYFQGRAVPIILILYSDIWHEPNAFKAKPWMTVSSQSNSPLNVAVYGDAVVNWAAAHLLVNLCDNKGLASGSPEGETNRKSIM
ncbi:hypothetical protein So717_36210 [Roseobacter cerasinus]|uniref:Uncharacterized protein n=1 Tax=Roseobacter cerasinus TaxID=2602289 RepID=A0A640VU03_9RHOB|nr:hypothetical protein [Roseobacter cerasinus]GFE51868.1 hypothetical protein So717_36210 [Roseobacter cerasinus]